MNNYKLKDICHSLISGGTPSTKNKNYYNGSISWLRTDEINFNVINETNLSISEDGLNNSSAKLIPKDSISIAMIGATLGKTSYINIELATNQNCCNLIPNKDLVNPWYLYYYLESKYKNLKRLGRGSPPSINKNIIGNLNLILPSLEKQNELVSILDNFKNLISTLKAELELREKQFNFYIDFIYDHLEKKYGLKELKEISNGFQRGKGLKKDSFVNSGIKALHYSKIYTDYDYIITEINSFVNQNELSNPIYVNYGDILFAISSVQLSNIGKSLAYLNKDPLIISGDIISFSHNENPIYLSIMLSSKQALKQKHKGKIQSSVVHTNQKEIEKIKIPVPEIDLQNRLSIFFKNQLDLINLIKKEISLREQQYIYYRDKLLDFGDKS